MGRLRDTGRFVARASLLLGVVTVLLLVFLTQTPTGRKVVLREVLRRIEGSVAGTIHVEGISSPGLLRGFTFQGVRIAGEDGRTFLEADSVMAGLSARALLTGDIILTRVAIWSPEITIRRLPGQASLNVVAIFSPPAPADSSPPPTRAESAEGEGGEATDSSPGPQTSPFPADSTQAPVEDSLLAAGDTVSSPGEGRTIAFHGLRIHDGRLDVLLPAPPGSLSPERSLFERPPEGDSLLRRLTFRDMELEVSEGVIRAPGQEGERFDVAALSFIGEIRPTPVRVDLMRGRVIRSSGHLRATVDELALPSSRASGTVDVDWENGDGTTVSVDGSTDGLALEDLRWIEPRLPEAVARGPFGLERGSQGFLLRFMGTRLALPGGSLQGRGGLLFGSTVRARDLDLDLDALDLDILDPWLPRPLPLQGRVSGSLRLAGGAAALAVNGDLRLIRGDTAGAGDVQVPGPGAPSEDASAAPLLQTDSADDAVPNRPVFESGVEAGSGVEASAADVVTDSLDAGGIGLVTDSLEAGASLTDSLAAGASLTDVNVQGTFHLGDTLGVTDLEATLAPFEWGILGDFSPAMKLRGPGAVRMEADGSLPGGIILNAEVTHVPAGLAPSRVTVRGTVLGSRENLFLNLRGELTPLSFSSMKRFFPDLPLTGDISGPVAVQGYLNGLDLEAELLTSAGPLGLEARFDARRPAGGYSVDSEFQEFLLSSLVPALPEPTRITGSVSVSGRGLDPDSVAGNAKLHLRRGEVGDVQVDTVAVEARVEKGLLLLDEFLAETNVGRLNARGAFGIATEAEDGELTVEAESASLEGLRPLFMGEIPLIREDLSSFEQDLLAVEGVELDTIPSAEDVAMGGSLRAQVELRGGIRDFSGEGTLQVDSVVYRTDYLHAGTLTFAGRGLPGEAYRIEGLLEADSLMVRGFSFQDGEVEVELGRRDGRFRVRAARGDREEYAARGTFVRDSLERRVNLDELNIEFDTIRWNLGGPTSLEWNSDGLLVRDFRLIRPGVGNMRVRADGFVPFRGEGAFDVGVEGLRLDRLASLIQMEKTLDGVASLDVHFQGTATDPSIQGTFSGDSLRYDVFSLDALDTEFAYRDRRLSGAAWASQGGRQVLMAEGSVPADLRVRDSGSRFPDGPVDLEVAVDSFPASLALVVVEGLEEVQGSLSGRVKLGGTRDELAPDGDLRLRDGSTFIPALGVRFDDVQAGFNLEPDGSVEVDGAFRSDGSGRVTGRVTLHPLADPALDLTVTASNLLSTARRDVQASLSGEVQVTQTYRKPRVEGSLTVERGVLMVEEVARSAEVVDLSDPRFISVVEQEAALRPVVEANQNPFLQNLMLAVDVSLARDSWLRGQDMNVEMDGELQVFWDRMERNLAMVGELQAVRGYYTVLGRQFQVQGGTVSFLGTPGVNPSLDIQALHRVRTVEEDENLEIIANVGGTLVSPRVSLSSNARYGIAESDLVSYLIFGRPSYALASGQNRYIRGATGSLLGAAGGAGLNFTLGTVGSQLGSVVARDFGLDYLTISQGEYVDPLGVPNWYGTLATTQVEIGQYLTDNVFAVLMWRPLSHVGSADRGQFAGLRLEWQLADLWTLEGFIEDRFMRSPLFTAGVGGANTGKIKGFSFWREWGY